MNFVEELATEIWNEEGFKSDLVYLAASNLLSELDLPIKSALIESEHHDGNGLFVRLLQAAMVFAECSESYFQETAQRISTAVLRGVDGDTAIRELFSLIHSRLRNFPALASAGKTAVIPQYAPLSLQYEFVRARTEQTIVIGDGAHVLTPFQLDSWRALNNRQSATLSAPTSAGKSYVLLLYIVEQFRSERASSIAYIVPTRALINQVSDDALREMTRREISDVIITSVPVDLSSPTPGKRRTKTLYVLTQERLEALLIAYPEIQLDLVVVDEAQMLGDGTRGVLLESVIDRITGSSPYAQFVFSGPMISNPAYFGEVFDFDKFAPCFTRRSPVTQNIVYLDYSAVPESKVTMRLSDVSSAETVGQIELPFRLRTDIDKLSYLSFLFGRSGSSIIYAAGKADAEKIAINISAQLSEASSESTGLSELIEFVKRHIHRDYALIGTLQKGVGFHYGHMPSLLRKQLEEHFKERRITFLVCTSTLLYGLNLPARNIFMHKPTTGRGSPISGPDFWNLSGRAGRLGKELEGNVYLIDYLNWATKPVQESKEIDVSSALKVALVDEGDELSAFLRDTSASSEAKPDFEITLGKLVLDARIGSLGRTVSRYRTTENADRLGAIESQIDEISAEIEIPTEVLNKNIGVSIFRQVDLLKYMVGRLKKLEPEELIPAHPLVDFDVARTNYLRAFKRIHTYLLKYPGRDNRHKFFSGLAVRWMRGDPLPMLIDSAIRYNRANGTGKSTASIIRDTMENIEDDLRFRYVKYFTCYNSLLEIALMQAGHEQYVRSIPNVPLFLEMGGSSGVMINLMALGLSRTTAESLSNYITDKDMALDQLRVWVQGQNFEQMDMSPICVREADELKKRLAAAS